jgi:hypothetical protein
MTTQRERILAAIAALGDTPVALRESLVQRGFKPNMTGLEHYLAETLDGDRMSGAVQEVYFGGTESVLEYLEGGKTEYLSLPPVVAAFKQLY